VAVLRFLSAEPRRPNVGFPPIPDIQPGSVRAAADDQFADVGRRVQLARMTVGRAFLIGALKRVADGGDIDEVELVAAIPDSSVLDKAERKALEQLTHWADDADIRARDRDYACFKRRWMRDHLAALEQRDSLRSFADARASGKPSTVQVKIALFLQLVLAFIALLSLLVVGLPSSVLNRFSAISYVIVALPAIEFAAWRFCILRDRILIGAFFIATLVLLYLRLA
jgi:hypothetical protein